MCNTELNSENCYSSYLKRGFKICKACDNKNRSKLIHKLRQQVINKLGGKCYCCGIDDFNFLSIDHINGNGIKDRKSFKSWKNYLKSILKLSDEDIFKQYKCLCFNCNYSCGFWEVCGHQLDKISENISILPVSNKGIKQTNLSTQEKNKRKNILRQINRIKCKLEMIQAYGNECCYCGENNPLFLVLDHINNNGYFNLGGHDFYQSLKRLGYPGKGTQLQLLCHNCNAKKEYIDNRFNELETIKLEPEIFIKQDYYISEENIDNLNKQASNLFSKLFQIRKL